MRRCCVYDTLHLYHSASVPFSLDVSDGQKAADVLYNVKVSTQNNPGIDLYLAAFSRMYRGGYSLRTSLEVYFTNR